MMAGIWISGLALLAFAASPGKPEKVEFGTFALGDAPVVERLHVKKRSQCARNDDLFSCHLLLADGIWYRFEAGKVVEKVIRVPSLALPVWLAATDSVLATKVRLQRWTQHKASVWVDDYGITYVELRDWMTSERGVHFNIVVRFRKGKMLDVTQTTLPHEDV